MDNGEEWNVQRECDDIIERLESINISKQEKKTKKKKKNKSDISERLESINISKQEKKTKKKKKNKNRKPLREDRYFGRFHCKKCNRMWESSFVFTKAGTKKVLYKQQCKTCLSDDAWYYPYALEIIRCSECECQPCECRCENCDGLIRIRIRDDPNTGERCEDPRFEYCNCKDDDVWILGDLIDPKKPHLSDLCGRCRSGRKCNYIQNQPRYARRRGLMM